MERLYVMKFRNRFEVMIHYETPVSGLRIKIIALLFLSYFFSITSYANDLFQKGHLKYQSLATDNQPPEHNVDARFNFSYRHANWALQADYQLLRAGTVINDKNRLFELTDKLHEGNEEAIVQRLDRLHLTHTSEQTVLRVGRQAISWGNGLVYNPMDFLNPFDPTAIDREYKTGDDMLYAQYLLDNGDDLQAVRVERRDEENKNTGEVSSSAAKYHIFLNDYEIDFLLGRHFDHRVTGVGGVANIGGSVWRSDIVSTEINGDRHISAVLNASYSWIAFGKNMSGNIEIFRNGFGIDNGDYSINSLLQNPQLINRINRGELFTLGRHYLAGSATVELTPLWLFTTSLFANLDDNSNLLQAVSQHDLKQNLQLLIAANIPVGDEGTEFGGIESAAGESLFLQIACYF